MTIPGKKRVTHKRNAHRQARAVWRRHHGEVPKGYELHHINGDPFDNRIENLEQLTSKEHKARHPHHRKPSPQAHEAAAEWHRSLEGQKWHREHGKRSWEKREASTMTCAMCGGGYETHFPTRSKWCSDACKMKALRRRRKAVPVAR